MVANAATSAGNGLLHTFALDATKLKDAVEADPTAVRDLLRADASDPAAGLAGRMRSALLPFTQDTDGLLQLRLDTLDARVKRFDERLTQLDERVARYQARTEKQFQLLETALAGLSSAQSFFANNKIGIY